MIDQDLIQQITYNSQQALVDAAPSPSPYLWVLENFLPSTALDKLRQFADSPDNEWTQVERQYALPRHRISWCSDSIIEELHDALLLLTPMLNHKFPDPVKHFWGISLWRDQPGYDLSWHTDNSDIDVAIQVYLFGNSELPGTDFEISDSIYSVPFSHNCGYLSCNSHGLGLSHRIACPVPSNAVRYSLYAVWSRFPKHIANA